MPRSKTQTYSCHSAARPPGPARFTLAGIMILLLSVFLFPSQTIAGTGTYDSSARPISDSVSRPFASDSLARPVSTDSIARPIAPDSAARPANRDSIPGPGDPDPIAPYDELYIYMTVQGVGSTQIPAAISNNTVFLSITDVFDYLKIKNQPSTRLDSISGFFITPQAPYLIDETHKQISYQGKIYKLKPGDLIRTETNLYLRSDYFGQIFGLACNFNFRSLSVALSSKLELPVVRDLRLEMMRNNLRHLKGEAIADTTYKRSYPFFRMGMVDWAAITTQNSVGPNDNRFYLALGSVLAGGETNIALNYDDAIPFREREQFYQWRFVDNDNAALRQVTAGKIYTQATSTLYYQVVGLQFSNSPTTYRRAFGTYTYSNYTQPNWIVELYVNNEMVDYTKADASGFFSFNVPLVYGNSSVRFRFYGPWGEERTSTQSIQIPFNFIPARQLEYTASAGVEEDSIHSRYARANANYGVNGRLTVGAGLEYLSSVRSSPVMPFVNASYRVTSNIALAGEYTHDVRTKFVGNYQSPKDMQIEIDYTRYKRGQQAINVTYLEERKFIFSMPVHKRRFSAFSRSTFYQIVLPGLPALKVPNTKYTTLEELISGSIFGVSTNFTTYGIIAKPSPNYFYSNLALSFPLPGKMIFTPSTQFEYDRNRFFEIRGELGKYIGSRGYANVFYEKNYKIAFQSIGIGLRWNFNFSQTGSTFRRTNGINSTVQSASGSVAYDDRTHHTYFSDRSNVGRGGLIFQPYLDLNNNGIWDRNEPKVKGMKIHINNGQVHYSKDGTTIRVSELEAYTSYIVKLYPDFDNIAWHIHKEILSIVVDPNQFKVIPIPVTVEGEITGTVFLKEDEVLKPQGRITINIYRDDRSFVGKTMTEADGTFDFSGLPPGSYIASLSGAQMDRLHMDARPISIPFTITDSKEGDLISNLKFVLFPLSTP